MSLSNLTIVVISLDRQQCLQRQLNYWKNTNVNLMIIDGSTQPTLLAVGESELTGFRYVHSPSSYRDRSLLAAELIETEYVAQLPDDEFFISSALSGFVEILQGDFSVDSIQGRTVRFIERNGELLGAKQYEQFKDSQDKHLTGIEAVKSFWSGNYVNSFPIYSVMRAQAYKKMIANTYSQPCENAYGYEIRYNLMFPFWFTTKMEDVLFWLRSSENDPVSEIGFNRTEKFSSWFLNPDNLEEKNTFIDQIVAALNIEDAEKPIAIEQFEGILSAYALRELQSSPVARQWVTEKIYRSLRIIFSSRFRSFVAPKLPHSIGKFFGYELRRLEKVAADFLKSGIYVDQSVLALIEEVVVNSKQT